MLVIVFVTGEDTVGECIIHVDECLHYFFSSE